MNQPSTINDQPSPASGEDLDAWGGEATAPVLIPAPGGVEPCLLKIDGECPDGCEACVEFARSMEMNSTAEGAEGRRGEKQEEEGIPLRSSATSAVKHGFHAGAAAGLIPTPLAALFLLLIVLGIPASPRTAFAESPAASSQSSPAGCIKESPNRVYVMRTSLAGNRLHKARVTPANSLPPSSATWPVTSPRAILPVSIDRCVFVCLAWGMDGPAGGRRNGFARGGSPSAS